MPLSEYQQTLPLPVQTLFLAFEELGHAVHLALRTQLGDHARLSEHKRRCLLFQSEAEQLRPLVPSADWPVLFSSVQCMIDALDEALSASDNLPDADPPVLGDRSSHGLVGRPAVEIDHDLLAALSSGRTTRVQLATIFECHPRTIRRRLLEHGLSEAGPPVFLDEQQPDGTLARTYFAGTSSDLSQLSDEELDAIVLSIYHQFPTFGRRMIDGYLLQLGERVPRSRILSSYHRTIGPSAVSFGPRRIQRRVYSVPGPSALWHHDGQHGLIRWKIVIHAFIDGFSRYVLGIRASNNNRALTVLDLFEDIADEHGYPSRVRGDHGTENLLVAGRMEQVRGERRGSYIWGRSVHNIRIERLWVDVTQGFGQKWKAFFQDLEVRDGLNQDSAAQIWLLHHLYLPSINDNASTWASTWNHHSLSIRGQRNRSPVQLYTQGTIMHGSRTVHADEPTGDSDEDFADYGIDWEAIEHEPTLHHHNSSNTNDGDSSNLFVSNQPDRLSHVEVPDTRCPFDDDEVEYLDAQLEDLPHFGRADMGSRRLLWIDALRICRSISR